MKTVLNAFLLFILLMAGVLLLGQVGAVPVPVVLTIGELNLATTAPVAILIALIILMTAFYLGRLTGWMIRLPQSLFARRRRAAQDHLADAYTSWFAGDAVTALQHLKAFQPETQAQSDLSDMLALSIADPLKAPPPFLDKKLGNPRLSAASAHAAALFYAEQRQWDDVARITAQGREFAPTHLPLLTLQFKALVNTNKTDEATTLLPALKGHLGTQRTKLIGQILQGPNALTARPVLEAHWVKQFEAWLPTGSDTFPTE